MARNTLITVVLAVAIALVGLFALLYFKAEKAVTATRLRTALPASVATPATLTTTTALTAARSSEGALPSREGLVTNREALRRDLLLQIQNLQQTLSAKQQDLAAQAQAMTELRTPSASENQSGEEVDADRAIDGRTEQVASLSANLDQMQAAREALHQQEEDALRARENEARLAAAQLDARIEQQEQAVANVQHQLDEWGHHHLTIAGQPQPNPDLQNQLNEQNRQLALLKEQKLGLTTEHRVQTEALFNLGQQAREELRSQEVDLRDQIFSLQSEIRRFQFAQKQAQNSSRRQVSRLQDLKQDYQQTSQQIQELRNTLRSKQSELKKLE
jgi:chromosome segregation ATPase